MFALPDCGYYATELLYNNYMPCFCGAVVFPCHRVPRKTCKYYLVRPDTGVYRLLQPGTAPGRLKAGLKFPAGNCVN